MDQTLTLKLKEFKKALDSLAEAVAELENAMARDSAIKRFEYSFELCWKTAKVFLSQNLGVDVFSPKECFRNLRKNKLISDEDTELLLIMTDDRNEVIHTYNEHFANELYDEIVEKYYKLLKKVYKILTEYK